MAAKPGQLERYDCEYKRNGTANLFIFLDVHRPWRKVKVTDSRAAVDFAACMRDLTDVYFPRAERIRVVWIICRPTRSVPFTKPSLRAKPDACHAGWSSILSQSTPVG